MLTIQALDPESVDLEPELKKYCKATGEQISRAHFYDMFNHGWFLFAKNGELAEGWIVVSVNVDRFTLERYIRVEMAYSETDYNSMKSIEADLDQLAKDIDANFVEMKTSFKAIADHAIKHSGYEIHQYVCRRKVED